jgi:hypothetical protein
MKVVREARNQNGDSGPMKRREAEFKTRRDEGDWRIMIGNIGTFPNESESKGKLKLDVLKHLYTSSDTDILLINEHNLNTRNITEKPQDIMKNWVENTQGRFTQLQGREEKEWDNKSRYEDGGTGIVTNRRATAHIIAHGEDARKMGRWNWITVKGKKDTTTTIISIYKPNKNQRTYERQLAKMRRIGITTMSAEQCWYEDLRLLIEWKKRENHDIIVGGDFNDDLNKRKGKVKEYMKTMGLTEALTERYGEGPATHNRGSTTIDGVFTTQRLNILQGGYVSEFESPGDHRFLWIDLKQNDIVGEAMDSRTPAVMRRATTKIPSVKESFRNKYEAKIEEYGLHKKMNKVYDYAIQHQDLDEEHQNLYEQIEEQVRRSVKYADKRCRKVRRGKVPFSDKAQKIRGEIEVKKLIIRRIRMTGRRGRPRMRKVCRLSEKYKYEGPKTFETMKEAEDSLKISYAKYGDFRPRAHEFRDTYLGRIASEFAEKDQKSAEWHFKRLQQQEKVKEQARRVKASEGRGGRAGVTKVDIEQEDGSMTTEYDKEKMEEAIIEANKAKRLQADNTPFRQEPLQSLLGEQMDFEKWDNILNGNIQLPEEGIEEGTRLWYDYIQTHNDATPMDLIWTTEEYFDSWKKMPENKSCLPGIHTVHLKCLDHTTKGAEVMSRLALIPLITGYAPKSMKYGVDSMIPKKAKGEHRPNKLRLILLMDARFNHNNKLIGRKMMEYGEKHGLLAEEQYGSRKAKSAIEHALNKRLIIDTTRQTKTDCVYIANDAKSCYDRILMMVAYLTMVEMGISKLAAKSSIACILDMKMKMRTSYGDSELTYGGEQWIKLPHGCGQGNGYGPAIWACISSPLLMILKRKGHGARITAPITKDVLFLSAISFVDDTDMVETALAKEAWEILLNRTQEGLDLWESLLRTTGGALEPTKSDWVAIRHEWKNGKSHLVKVPDPTHLTVRNPAGTRENLKQKRSNEARETLGVWQAPDGNEKTQTEKLIEKIDDWRENISTSRINRKDTTWAVRTTIGKSIRYPLAATTLSGKECEEVEKTLKKAAYGKMGVVRTAPQYLGSAPKEFGGLGIQSGILENQTIDQVIMTLRHGHTQTATGKLIRASAENLCVESGLPGDPYDLPAKDISWTTDNTWIQNSIKNMQEFGISMQSGIKGIKEWTTNDGFLMEEAAQFLRDKLHLAQFNKVRMHVQAATLSDILTADCRNISQDMYMAKKTRMTVTPSASAYAWPKVPPPSRAELRIWQSTLKLIFSVQNEDLRVQTDTERTWDEKNMQYFKWLISNDNQYLYRKEEGEWTKWRKDERVSRRQRYVMTADTVQAIPQQARPCSVTIEQDIARLQSTGDQATFEEDRSEDNTFGWIIPSLQGHEEEEGIYARHIEQQQGEIVSDGSYKHNRTTSAFVVLPNKIINGSNTIPGEPDDQSSYRGELGGILASIVYTNSVCKKHNITAGKCKMYCDNKGALSASFGWKTPNPRWSCYDIVSLIRLQLAISPIKWEGIHIKGHQDDHTAYDDLDYIAQGNVDADRYAEAEMEIFRAISPHKIDGTPWTIKHQGKIIAGNTEKRIRKAIHESKMQEVWRKKFGLTREQAISTSWKAFKRNNRTMDEWKSVWMTKYNQRIGGVRKNMERRKHSTDSVCPCCEDTEDTDHILRCANEEIEEIYKSTTTEIHEWMETTSGTQVAHAFREVCDAIREQRPLENCEDLDPSIISAATGQVQLGQRAFIGGWWSREWLRIHTAYAKRTGQRNKNSIVWMSNAIIKYQDLIRSMWFERNDQLHHKETSEAATRGNIELNGRIDEIYTKLHRVAPHRRMLTKDEKSFFSKSKEQHKGKKIKTKRKWVQDAEDVLEVYEQRTRGGQAMRDYIIYHLRDPG